MKKMMKLIVAVLVIAILAGVLLAELRWERDSVLGVWKMSIRSDDTIVGMIDLNGYEDIELLSDLSAAIQRVEIPVCVQLNTDGSYRIYVDKKDATNVSEQYMQLVSDYLVNYVERRASEIAGEKLSGAANIANAFIKKYVGVDLADAADQTMTLVAEKLLACAIDKALITDYVLMSYEASGNYRVGFGKLWFSANKWEDIQIDNVLRYTIENNCLELSRSGSNSGAFCAVLGFPLSRA